MYFKKCFFLTLLVLTPFSISWSAEFKGFVRSVNYKGHSFSVDVPPLQRVKINASTQIEEEKGDTAFKKYIQEGDYVRVEGEESSNALVLAKKIEVQKNQEAKTSNEIQAKLDQSFLLEVLQNAKLEGTEVELYFAQLVDELCDTGMDCIDKGKLTVKVLLKKGKESKALELVTQGGRKPLKPVFAEAFGFKVELIEVGEYAALLVVRKE